MKKQVATILGNMAYEIKQCDCKDPALGLAIKQATLEICQLSQERVERLLREIEARMYNKSPLMIMPRDWESLWEKELE